MAVERRTGQCEVASSRLGIDRTDTEKISMKNQYFGDIGDYGKYGLLRFIANHGITIAINWYLTPDDNSNDGNIRSYLTKEQERIYDPELFDILRMLSVNEKRDVNYFASQDGIPGAVYFDTLVQPLPNELTVSAVEKRTERERWHQQALKTCGRSELVFMDPDNGLKSGNPTARKDSTKFVYASEISDYYKRGQDVFYYCHKGRRTESQWEQAKRTMLDQCPDAKLMGVTYHRGTQRSYIFIVHPEKEEFFSGLIKEFLKTEWGKCFTEEIIES